MNNNENDFTNIQPQGNMASGSVPPLNQNTEMPGMNDSLMNSMPNMNSNTVIPEMNSNMGVPEMSEPAFNPVSNMNSNMEAPGMSEPAFNPVSNMNSNMEAPEMSEPAFNPVPNMNSNIEAPGMSEPAFNSVPNMNSNMEAPGMSEPAFNPVPNMNSNTQMPNMNNPVMNPIPNVNSNMGAVPPLNTNINTTNKGFMSKYGKYIFIGLAVVVIAAVAYLLFGGKKLECSMEDDYAGMKMTQSVQVKFNGSKANYVQMIMSIDLSGAKDELKDYTSVLVETLKSQTEQYKNKGMAVDIKENASSIVVTITAKRDTMSLLDMSEEEATFDEIKKSLEKEGYTCK